MAAEKWSQVKEILDAAIRRKPEERPAFLDVACDGDEGVRREVESLLSSFGRADGFMDRPALEPATTRLDTFSEGKMLGRYEIVSVLGKGGMGEVYLAKDRQLRRRVSIKVLSETLSSDRGRLNRFEQEAVAASALNHPNILTIHEIGEADGAHFLVSEYVKGVTLREEIGRVELPDALGIAIQTASALEAAHKGGIIHRDIKPENIMVREDGLVKVLDFGLAKLTQQHSLLDTEAETLAQVDTQPGTVMGTVTYMSPEQARGKETDARTDIWSLGVVLYELIAGKPPFVGETTGDVIAEILKAEPPPLELQGSGELAQVINKALAKDKDERYQTTRELITDLKKIKTTNVAEPGAGYSVPRDDTVILGQQTARAAHVTARSIVQGRGRRIGYAAAAICVLIAAVFGWTYFLKPAPPFGSLAVMPLVNETGNPESEYLSDGITESLIGRLSEIPDLSVKARSSVFRYKGKDIAITSIGDELNVPAILMGHVRRRGNEFVLYVELVDAATENIIWKGEYNRPDSSLAAIPGEIARDVASNIRHRLSGTEEQKLTRNYTENSNAYELYLKGRFHWDKRNAESYRIADDAYKQAIAIDPNYALAYAGLADLYLFREADLGRNVAIPQAKTFALKALELDESLAEAHTTLAFVNANYDFDMPAAEAGFKRAIELKPNYAIAHQFYAGFLVQTGRTEEGLAESRRAVELEPFSAAINWHFGLMLTFARRYDEAIAQELKTLQIQPNYALAEGALAGLYMQVGRLADAAAHFQKRIERDNKDQGAWLAMAKIQILSGNREEGQKILARVISENSSGKINSYVVAGVYTALGDRDKAIEWLNRGYEQRVFPMYFLRVDPVFDPIRDDARFQEIVRRIGLST